MKRESISVVLNNLGKVTVMAAVLLTSLTFFGCGDTMGGEQEGPPPKPPALSEDEIVKKAGPSVVNIEAKGSGKGSGIIFSEDGYVVTNDHVIRGANSIEVHLSDKRSLKAKLVGTDPRSDIAVIKVEGDNLQVAEFANSSEVKVGDGAVAIGNPKGIENSATKGIISNLNIDVDTGIDFRRCLQTDAPVNPGNSGGALVNMWGEVIGINDLMRTDAESMNYAIPSDDAKKVAQQLIDNGYVSYPYLGVAAVNKKEDDTPFILVGEIMDNSPAAKAGVHKNDVIFLVNDARVETVSKLREQLYSAGIGSVVSLGIIRKTNQGIQKGTIQVTLEELPKGYYTIDWS